MIQKTLVLAHAGLFSDNKILTHEMLRQMVKNFPPDGVPLSFGHFPKPDMPKLGKILSINLVNDQLIGIVKMQDTLAQVFEQGLFDSWSIGAKKGNQGWYLHHLAILGEEPPAIKDLKSKTKEFLGMTASDKYDVIYFRDRSKGVGFQNKVNQKEKYEEEKMDIKIEDQLAAMTKRIDALEKELKEKENIIETMGQAVLDNDMEALEQAMKGKVSQETQEVVKELADMMSTHNSISLSDNNPLKLLKKIFDGIPQQVKTGRINFNNSGNQDRSQTMKQGAI